MRRSRTFLLLLAFGMIALSFSARAVRAQDAGLKTVTVSGSGMDQQEAIHDAKRKAIEEAAGTYIYSQSKTEDFVLVKDTVLARSAGFVQSFEVLSSQTSFDGIVTIRAKAVVSVQGIKDLWGTVTMLLKDRGRPKIMVFIQERIAGQVQPSSTVQTRIEQQLLKSGFQLVDRNQIKAIDEKDLAVAISESDPAKAQAIAQRFGAQLFITGLANAASGGVKNLYGTEMYTYEAEANIRCYRSDTGQLLSSTPGTATRGVQRVWRSAAKQALDLQAQQITPKVVDDILRFWQDALEGRGEVQLKISNIGFKEYLDLKKALNTLRGVKDVRNANYSNKIAELSIETDLTAEALAEKIVTEIDSKIEIEGLTQNVIKGKYGS
ncbi:MAG: hypothetical protein ACOCZE_03210 [Planctomycetota bacterium]